MGYHTLEPENSYSWQELRGIFFHRCFTAPAVDLLDISTGDARDCYASRVQNHAKMTVDAANSNDADQLALLLSKGDTAWTVNQAQGFLELSENERASVTSGFLNMVDKAILEFVKLARSRKWQTLLGEYAPFIRDALTTEESIGASSRPRPDLIVQKKPKDGVSVCAIELKTGTRQWAEYPSVPPEVLDETLKKYAQPLANSWKVKVEYFVYYTSFEGYVKYCQVETASPK